jgi:hypothetical protein
MLTRARARYMPLLSDLFYQPRPSGLVRLEFKTFPPIEGEKEADQHQARFSIFQLLW